MTVGILCVVIALTAVPAFTQEPHAPSIADLFPHAIFGDATLFEFNRLTLARFIVAIVLCAVLFVVASRLSLIPSRGQQVIELAAEFVRQEICVNLLGNKQGRRYAPVLGAIFLGVLCMNITGVLPGINIAASSVIAVPIVFAAISFVTFVSAGIREQGAYHFFVGQLFPKGLPWPLYFLITPIEFFSTFIVRPVTLSIRLMANMVAGHMLLAVTYFGTATLLGLGGVYGALAIGTGISMLIVTLFEIFVAFLQAYIFTMLSAVYIKLSVEAH